MLKCLKCGNEIMPNDSNSRAVINDVMVTIYCKCDHCCEVNCIDYSSPFIYNSFREED